MRLKFRPEGVDATGRFIAGGQSSTQRPTFSASTGSVRGRDGEQRGGGFRHRETTTSQEDDEPKEKAPSEQGFLRERATGVEPATSSLGSWHSTAELRPRELLNRS